MERPLQPEINETDQILNRIKEGIERRSDQIRNFETSAGYSASLRTYENGLINGTLSKDGNTSTFAFSPDGAMTFIDLVGTDDDLIIDKKRKEELRKVHQEQILLILDDELNSDLPRGIQEAKPISKQEYFDTINNEKQRGGDPND